MKNKLDPKNESHWMTHANHEARRDEKLTRHTNPTLWGLLTKHGAPKPRRTDSWWNDWAANNPTPAAKGLKALDPSDAMMMGIKAITTGARPVNW